MSMFVIDSTKDQSLVSDEESLQSGLKEESKKNEIDSDSDTDETEQNDYWGLPPPHVDISDIIRETLTITDVEPRKTENDIEREKALEMLNYAVEAAEKNSKISRRRRTENITMPEINPVTGKFENDLIKTDVGIEMEHCVLNGIQKATELPQHSKRKQYRLNQIERSKTKGPEWFDLPATELTEEVENDLKILQMRSVLNPKHFYKKNDLKVLPKYFQIGTVQPSPLDYYNERNVRKNKKKTLVDELMADTEFQQYNKRKYTESMSQVDKYAHRKAIKKMKKLKKNK